ncbi:hypothetical protein K502DRAFT_327875 [Neoconidiobolus thromboides FSU 785]|nr:hypothetical protein K502DRAFT_327875 [Neoconidiobolus thromboides FSU 785]
MKVNTLVFSSLLVLGASSASISANNAGNFPANELTKRDLTTNSMKVAKQGVKILKSTAEVGKQWIKSKLSKDKSKKNKNKDVTASSTTTTTQATDNTATQATTQEVPPTVDPTQVTKRNFLKKAWGFAKGLIGL